MSRLWHETTEKSKSRRFFADYFQSKTLQGKDENDETMNATLRKGYPQHGHQMLESSATGPDAIFFGT